MIKNYAFLYNDNQRSYQDKSKSVLKDKISRFQWSSTRRPKVIIFGITANQSLPNFNTSFSLRRIIREQTVVLQIVYSSLSTLNPMLQSPCLITVKARTAWNFFSRERVLQKYPGIRVNGATFPEKRCRAKVAISLQALVIAG